MFHAGGNCNLCLQALVFVSYILLSLASFCLIAWIAGERESTDFHLGCYFVSRMSINVAMLFGWKVYELFCYSVEMYVLGLAAAALCCKSLIE